MKNKYSTADIARTLSVSERTARRYIDKHLYIRGNSKFISKEFFDLIIHLEQYSGQGTDTVRTEADTEEFDRIEYFTEQEYQEFQKRLIEYPMLLDKINLLLQELEHNKKLLEMNIISHNNLINTIKERNFIEAKEKNLDK